MIATELLKLRTIRSPWLLLGTAQVLVLLGAAGRLVADEGRPPAELAIGAVAHLGLTSLIPLVLGVLAVAGEYRHKTIVDTYLGTPRRGRVVGAKLAVYLPVGLGFGLVTAVTVLSATWVGLTLKGDAMPWSDPELWRTVAGGVVWNALFAAIGVGVGAVLRNLAAAIAATLAWLALVEGLVAQLVGDDAARWLPFAAGRALGRLPGAVAGGLSPWVAAGVLLAYAVAAAGGAVLLTVRRDVT
jgi:ABC-2 type transport system permease protein